MDKNHGRSDKDDEQMSNEEEPVGPPTNRSHGSGVQEMEDNQGGEAGEDVGLEEAGGEDACGVEELEVEEHVQPEEDEDETSEDAVEAVEVFVGGAEGGGEGIGGLEGEEMLDGELRDGDDTEAFGQVEEV